MSIDTIYCQQCTARNSMYHVSCARCGAPLHVVSPPVGLADDPFPHAESFEEHLLERISILEVEVSRLRQHNDRLLELMHRQATTTFNDHALLDALISVLEERGSLNQDQIEDRFRQLLDQYTEEVDERQRIETRKREMLDSYSGNDGPNFDVMVEEGVDQLLNGSSSRGLKKLRRAFVLDPRNKPLALFLGEFYFFDGRRALAKHFLECTLSLDPGNAVAAMMLGVVCGDEGETESAKEYFQRAIKARNDAFVAHFGLGRLLAGEGRYREARSHFKRALTLSPSAEIHYLVGRTYIEEGRIDSAERHLRKAILIDPDFDQALYHLGLIYLDRADLERAREYFRAASDVCPEERRYRTALTAKDSKRLRALPVFTEWGLASRTPMASGDDRFASLVMQYLASNAFGSRSNMRG